MSWLLPWLLGVALAANLQGFYLESPASSGRAEAARVARVATAEGMRARVVRRYRHGQGWEYVARVEGLSDREEAEALASTLAEEAGVPVRVFRVEGEVARAVARASGPEPTDPPAAPEDELAWARQVMAELIRAHGGAHGGLAAVEAADSVRLTYRRYLPDGGKVLHTWARRGDEIYLEIHVEAGAGVDSRLLVTERGAWLARDEEAQPRGRDAALRQVLRFGPRAVLGLPLAVGGFSADMARPGRRLELPELGACQPVGVTLDTGKSYDLCVDPDSHRLVAARAEGDAVVQRWRGYRELEVGVVVPAEVRSYREGKLVDHVEILGLDLHPDLPGEWFSPQGM